MNKYILGDQVILTTEERYKAVFKEMGYKPYVEVKKEVKSEKTEEEPQKKTIKSKK